MRNDNFLDRSREIISGNDPILDEILTACAEDVTAGDPGVDTVTRLEDVYTCSQLRVGTGGTCTVDRDFALIPVATQTILTVVGGACVPSAAGTGKDNSDWSTEWNAQTYTLKQGPPDVQWCRTQSSGPPDGSHFMRRGQTSPFMMDFYWSANFCGEFDAYVPTATECEESARMLEHACRNAPSTTSSFTAFQLQDTGFYDGPMGGCTTYASDDPLNFDGTIPVDYTGCTPERQTFCTSVFDHFVAECTRAPGDNCGVNCGSGDDYDEWSALSGSIWPREFAFSNEPPNTERCEFAEGVGGGDSEEPGYFVLFSSGSGTSEINHAYYTGYCGRFENGAPSSAECEEVARNDEWFCRHDGVTQVGNGNGVPGPDYGPYGTCSTAGDYTNRGGQTIDYTGCDQDRIDYCQRVYQETLNECSGVCTGNCAAEDNIAVYGAGNVGVVGPCTTEGQQFFFSPPPDMSPIVGPGRNFSFWEYEDLGSLIYNIRGTSTDVCGDTVNPDCTAAADAFENSCNVVRAYRRSCCLTARQPI